MEFIFKLIQRTYKYYYNVATGDILAKAGELGTISTDLPYFTSTNIINIHTHRYNTETEEVEPKE